ncbi:MAG TPA: Xaa-Pro peptidase family protein [Symbiobacteriaceae bacterium]|nr:Xaa-Pro peptidase family protein [Symbiobacteriaceae bacterium]
MIIAAEYHDRLARLKEKLRQRQVDSLVVSAEDSIYYLTGVSYKPLERPFFMIVRAAAEPVLLVPALEQDHLRAAPNVSEVRHYWDYPSPPGEGWPERLQDLLAGAGRVAVEPTLPLEIYSWLRDLDPETLPLVEELRVVKCAAEVQKLRRAAYYADYTVERIFRASYHGVSELELFSQGRSVQLQIMKHDGYEALTTNVLAASWPAPLSAQPHGVPAVDDRLGDGPHIALGFVRVNGYAAECERTYFLAPPTAQVREAFAAMQEARRRAYALIRPGTPCTEVDLAAKRFLQDEGFGPYLLHRTGHGFGLGNHEAPWVAEGSTEILAENMLISVEPGIYLPGVGGIRHSDTTLVTRNGYENLTRFPSDLESMTLLGRKPLQRMQGALVRRAVGMR